MIASCRVGSDSCGCGDDGAFPRGIVPEQSDILNQIELLLIAYRANSKAGSPAFRPCMESMFGRGSTTSHTREYPRQRLNTKTVSRASCIGQILKRRAEGLFRSRARRRVNPERRQAALL